jgi:hypothetical protein
MEMRDKAQFLNLTVTRIKERRQTPGEFVHPVSLLKHDLFCALVYSIFITGICGFVESAVARRIREALLSFT